MARRRIILPPRLTVEAKRYGAQRVRGPCSRFEELYEAVLFAWRDLLWTRTEGVSEGDRNRGEITLVMAVGVDVGSGLRRIAAGLYVIPQRPTGTGW